MPATATEIPALPLPIPLTAAALSAIVWWLHRLADVDDLLSNCVGALGG